MTDDLRDRIAALLELLRPATPREAADAVIRELEAIPFTDQIDRSGVRYPLSYWTSSNCPDYLKKWIADE